MAHPIWRGVTICPDMKGPLDELARISGNDILVKPIPGFGSYRTNAASAGTDSGGGHVDLALGKLNSEQKLRLERLARQVGFYADIREPRWWSPTRRKWLSKNWASHLHMILKECPHLSPQARAQVKEWYAGENGLVGDDPDDGDRTFLRQTWAQYLARKTGTTSTVKPPAPAIDLANLKFNKRNPDVKRYQAAVWKALAPAVRAQILARHQLKESQITDGFYGKVTREMTAALYDAIQAAEPKGGWPDWTEPGPRLLKRLGFVPRDSSRDLDATAEPVDEFGEPATLPDDRDIETLDDELAEDH
jgi:hypothetical protein